MDYYNLGDAIKKLAKDERLVEQFIRTGNLNEKELKEWRQSQPDCSANMETLSIGENERM